MVQTGGVEVFALHKKSQPSPGSTKSVQPKLNHAQEGYLLDSCTDVDSDGTEAVQAVGDELPAYLTHKFG